MRKSNDFVLSQKMVVERVTPHLLQGKMLVLLQIEVSMPPNMLIR